MKRVLFVAGDPSGDALSARVAAETKARGAEVWALGGPALRRVADRWLGDLVSEGVMGFWEPLKKIPVFVHFLKNVLEPALAEGRPDVVVPTDFYGFNRWVAAAAKKAGSRVFYFISPQVWASRPGRVRVLKTCVDRMLVLFPFEEKLYREAGVPVTFVGHPLLDLLPEVPADPPLKVESTVGLLPGSRPGEVSRLLPIFLEVVDRLPVGTRVVLFAAPTLSNAFYDRWLSVDRIGRHRIEVVRDEQYAWRRGVDVALACSGTATLENALLGLPTVVAYRTSWPTYVLARAMARVSFIAMPNLLAGRAILPEFIQSQVTADNLARAVVELLEDPHRRRAARTALLALRPLLGGPGAVIRAAQTIGEGTA